MIRVFPDEKMFEEKFKNIPQTAIDYNSSSIVLYNYACAKLHVVKRKISLEGEVCILKYDRS
jgi:hypothetical protein